MNLINVSFRVPPEIYGVLQAAAAKAGMVLQNYVRQAVFEKACVNVAEVEIAPLDTRPKLTSTKRLILTLLQKHADENPSAPHLTTLQITTSAQRAPQATYLNLRALLREGMIDRGMNVHDRSTQGAPLKSYTISDLGRRVLSEEEGRIKTVHESFQNLQASRWKEATESLARASMAQAPRVSPQTTPDQTYKPQVHAALRYIAMDMTFKRLGRPIHSEADVDAMKATHAALVEAVDKDVSSGAHTYASALGKLTDRIESEGGMRAIAERFNVG